MGDFDQKSNEINGDEAPTTEQVEKGLKERKVSWGKLGRIDSLNREAGKVSNEPGHKNQLDLKTTLSLAFQSVGVIYGDVGTSPFGIGLYNLFKHDVTVLRAFNPMYIIRYFQRNGKTAWISLGGVVLCITGTEAMFADLGHFSVRAIQISFSGVVFPALLSCYIGQAAYLSKFPDDVHDTFYKSIPNPIYWPTFVIAVAAAIIASQAMISAAFSIITQALSLGAFPRVKVIHTSAKYEGQVYIPELNYFIMIATVLITLVFRTTEQIGNAYGIAVISVMVITTNMVTLIMLFIWKTSIWLVALFYVVVVSVEVTYLSAVLFKFTKGGYLPVILAIVLMSMMGIWHYVHKQRYMFELKNKVSGEFVRDLIKNPDVNRIPGIGLLYSELVQGIPPIFPHFVDNIPSIHSVLVFVSIKRIPVSKVAPEERFLFRQVERKDYRMFRCVARYGYNDAVGKSEDFEQDLVQNMKEFIRYESYVLEYGSTEDTDTNQLAVQVASVPHSGPIAASGTRSSSNSSSGIHNAPVQEADKEIEFVQKAMEKGVVYLLGETEVVAEEKSSLLKQVVVNYLYHFLRKNLRESDKILSIPNRKLLKVGMTYEI
ncbi:hypothetical protein MKX01_012899 [Papaver californicum]|nr:hypothetical protein MKX01_012899 [Papaver californicum]